MTTEPLRIGLNMGSNEPYWVMVREAIIQHAPNLPVQLVHLEIDQFHDWSRREVELTVDGLRAQRVGAIISWGMPESFSLAALDAGMIIFIAAEARLRHPRLLGLSTLYDSAREVGGLVMRSLNGKGHVLAVEGVALMDGNTDSRGQGFRDAAKRYPGIQLTGLPIPYPPVDPQPYIEAALLELDQPADAIVCASDYLALQVSKAARSMGLLPAGGLVAGIGGDPLALEAIARGEMTATVDITPPALCCKILEYTWKMMRGQPVAGPLKFSTNLVTIQNVTEVMKEKFLTVARLPSRMVGVNREQQLRHTDQLEWSLQVIRRLSASLDRRQVLDEITQMVRDRYHYDRAYVYFWSQDHQALLRDDTLSSEAVVPMVRLTDGGLVGQVYVDARPVVILDAQHSAVYPLDPAYPHTRSRTILPIRLGETVTGVLDLHSHQLMDQDQEDLLGLQLLADQVGIAFRNARLYEDALRSLRLSEEADRLKTRLLANVSHELRTPLNLILSYSKLGLRDLHQQDDLREDLQVIQTSAVHLQRLINDLLDLSRAEIDELKLYPETISPRPLMLETFEAMRTACASPQVEWRWNVPERLPWMQIDPARFKQILLNLLSNAEKFTDSGHIELGCAVEPPNLHLWVEDTGPGIVEELQARIFEPFVTSGISHRGEEGIGLGLAITRRFVALHKGSMRLDSNPGRGSTFHVYLPLPNLSGKTIALPEGAQRVLLVVSSRNPLSPAVEEMAERQALRVLRVSTGMDLTSALRDVHPVALAWDMLTAGQADWALLEELQRFPSVAQSPFILFAQDELAQRGADPSGLTGVVSKPYDSRSFKEIVQSMHPGHGTEPILIVEDHLKECEALVQVVSETFPESPIRCFHDGKEAVDWLINHTPSLVLLDLMLPGKSGFEVLDFIRSHPATAQKPVVVVSGKKLTPEEIERLDYNRVAYQVKQVLSRVEFADVLQRAGEPGLPQVTSVAVKRAIGYIHNHYGEPFSRQELARAIGVSESYLSHIFHEEMGLPLWEFLTRYRILEAQRMLLTTSLPVRQIAAEVGFEDAAYFSRAFQRVVGQSPREFRHIGLNSRL